MQNTPPFEQVFNKDKLFPETHANTCTHTGTHMQNNIFTFCFVITYFPEAEIFH